MCDPGFFSDVNSTECEACPEGHESETWKHFLCSDFLGRGWQEGKRSGTSAGILEDILAYIYIYILYTYVYNMKLVLFLDVWSVLLL